MSEKCVHQSEEVYKEVSDELINGTVLYSCGC
jgi:hypothetical protein